MPLFSCHPRVLADALNNAVIFGNGTGRSLKPNDNSCPYVYLAYQASEDGSHGVVAVYGSGRYISGRTLIHLEGQTPDGPWLMAIDVLVAKELQSKLRASPIGMDVTAAVDIHAEPELTYTEDGDEIYTDVTFYKQEEILADLGNADPDGSWEWSLDIVDVPLTKLGDAVVGPLALTLEDLNRLTSVTSDSPVIDFIKTSYPGVIAFRQGADVVGVVGEVGRELYVAGGKWGVGPGKPEHLFTSPEESTLGV